MPDARLGTEFQENLLRLTLIIRASIWLNMIKVCPGSL